MTDYQAGKAYNIYNKNLGWFKARLIHIYKDGRHYFQMIESFAGYASSFTVEMNEEMIKKIRLA